MAFLPSRMASLSPLTVLSARNESTDQYELLLMVCLLAAAGWPFRSEQDGALLHDFVLVVCQEGRDGIGCLPPRPFTRHPVPSGQSRTPSLRLGDFTPPSNHTFPFSHVERSGLDS